MAARMPRSMDELNEATIENVEITGVGFAVMQHLPCPFCASPRWASFRVLEVQEAMASPHKCGRCGRSAKAIVTRSEEGMTMEIVQTGGAPQPEWLEPKMRIVGEVE